MRRAKTSILPGIDTMEPRLLLSTAAPLVTRHELNGVVREIKAIVSSLARTDDTVQASMQLSGLSSQLPVGIREARRRVAKRSRAVSASFREVGHLDRAADHQCP